MSGPSRDLSGLVLGERWRLERRIGEGGMGAVYRGAHVRNGKRVAVKVLHEGVADPDMVARFHREGYLANLVDDPGVVAVLDDGVDSSGTPYLVMELLEGESIEDRAQRKGGKLGWEEVLAIAHPALVVLAKAHAVGIVHRDLKPSNLFLTSEGRVKVLDFGLAGLRAAQGRRVTGPTSPTMGTLGFMPPEQAAGDWDRVDARSDIWAMGATLWALLTGVCVHEPGDSAMFFNRVLTAEPAPLRSLAPEVPLSVAAIVDRALVRDRLSRFESAEEMAELVQLAYHGLTGEDVTDLSSTVNRLLPSALAGSIGGRPGADTLPSAPGVARSMTPPSVGATRPGHETLPSAQVEVSQGRSRSASGVVVPSTPSPRQGLPLKALFIGAGTALALGGVAAVWLTRAPAPPSSTSPSSGVVTTALTITAQPSVSTAIAPDVAPSASVVATGASATVTPPPLPAQKRLPQASPPAATPAAPAAPTPVDLDRRH
ncbi:MAG: serine/threonine protein kinase [Myxococcales bacterium]|nr:serine/threonine protein kinase [Myxococcales bacterium]